MEENKQHFQRIMLNYFKKGKNATETQKKICTMYGEGAVTDQMCQMWFVKSMLHGQCSMVGHVDQLKLMALKPRHRLRTINVIPHWR